MHSPCLAATEKPSKLAFYGFSLSLLSRSHGAMPRARRMEIVLRLEFMAKEINILWKWRKINIWQAITIPRCYCSNGARPLAPLIKSQASSQTLPRSFLLRNLMEYQKIPKILRLFALTQSAESEGETRKKRRENELQAEKLLKP